MEHVLRLSDDGVQRPLAIGDLQHVGLQLGCHVRLGYASAVVLQRLGQRYPAGRRDHVVPLDVVPGVQLSDDVVPGGLGPQLEPVHLLDERPLVVSVRRLRLGFHEAHGPDLHLVADLERGELGVAGLQVFSIVLLPALLLQDVAFGVELLAFHVQCALGDLRLRVGSDGGEEPADDELVELPLVPFHLGRRHSCRGVYRRMVRGAPLPLGRDDLLLGQDLLRL